MRIDPRSVTAETITFAGDTLTINLPQRTFVAGCPYFLRLVDEIPAATTIGATVVITIGTGTVEYPLVDLAGVPVTAERLRSGYSYPIVLVASGTTGAFKVIAPLKYCFGNEPFTADGTDPSEGGAGA
jgi:hypothetical protein